MLSYIAIALIVLLIIASIYFYHESFMTSDSLILYHASWCGHCKNLMPIWNQLEQYIKSNKPNINVNKILCDNNQECKNLAGYPTIIYIKDGIKHVFNKERTLDNLRKFLDQPAL